MKILKSKSALKVRRKIYVLPQKCDVSFILQYFDNNK